MEIFRKAMAAGQGKLICPAGCAEVGWRQGSVKKHGFLDMFLPPERDRVFVLGKGGRDGCEKQKRDGQQQARKKMFHLGATSVG